MIKRFRLILLLTFLSWAGCINERQSSPVAGREVDTVKITQAQIDESLWKIFKELSINQIKKNHERGTTSGILSNEEGNHFFEPDTIGYYGFYFFVNQESNNKQPYLCKAVVFFKSKPWKYSDKTEGLIEITSYSNQILLLPEVRIGASVDTVISKLGNPDLRKSKFLLYQDAKGVILTIKVDDFKVSAIRMGMYKYMTLDELENETIKNL